MGIYIPKLPKPKHEMLIKVMIDAKTNEPYVAAYEYRGEWHTTDCDIEHTRIIENYLYD